MQFDAFHREDKKSNLPTAAWIALFRKRRQMLCSCSSESTMYYCYMQCRICWHYTTSTRTSATYHRQLCVFSEDKQLICLPVSKLFQCSFWLSSSITHLPYLTTVLMTGVYRTHVCHELVNETEMHDYLRCRYCNVILPAQ
jgi:hypothetical protein